jgi:spore coat protein CotH
LVLGVLWCLACGTGEERGRQVFDPDQLHEITIEVDPTSLAQLDSDGNQRRVPCTLVYDGVRLERAGIRRKGTFGSLAKVAQKSGYSVRFDEFVPGQRLFGLKRLTLDNAKQDASFLNEHLGYEVARRAGLPSPRTAHARLSLNGTSYGLYVVKETVEKQFLQRVFGTDEGNLYEGTAGSVGNTPIDFVVNPDSADLKDELDEQRHRDDLRALAAAIALPADGAWADRVGRLIDLDAYVTLFAVEIAVHHWDGYAFNANNYYLYNDPARGKFVMIPHGMDQLWSKPDFSPDSPAKGLLAQRVRQVPALADRLRAEVVRVARDAMEVGALDARADKVMGLLAGVTAPEPRLLSDIQRFQANFAGKRASIAARQKKLVP